MSKYNFKLLNKIIEKDSIELLIECDFVPASRPRVSKFGTYIAEPYKTFKKELFVFFKNEFSEVGNDFKSFPLSIDISFYKQFPKSFSKKKKEDCLKTGCISRPDLDNYYKSILDGIDSIFYTDDSFVVELSGRKLYTEQKSYVKLKIKKFYGA